MTFIADTYEGSQESGSFGHTWLDVLLVDVN